MSSQSDRSSESLIHAFTVYAESYLGVAPPDPALTQFLESCIRCPTGKYDVDSKSTRSADEGAVERKVCNVCGHRQKNQ